MNLKRTRGQNVKYTLVLCLSPLLSLSFLKRTHCLLLFVSTVVKLSNSPSRLHVFMSSKLISPYNIFNERERERERERRREREKERTQVVSIYSFGRGILRIYLDARLGMYFCLSLSQTFEIFFIWISILVGACIIFEYMVIENKIPDVRK